MIGFESDNLVLAWTNRCFRDNFDEIKLRGQMQSPSAVKQAMFYRGTTINLQAVKDESIMHYIIIVTMICSILIRLIEHESRKTVVMNHHFVILRV